MLLSFVSTLVVDPKNRLDLLFHELIFYVFTFFSLQMFSNSILIRLEVQAVALELWHQTKSKF